jgi:hypothetical protein
MSLSRSILQLATWLLIGLSVLPQLSSAGPEPEAKPSQEERLESLLTAHDVRYAIKASRGNSTECLRTEPERGQ